MVVDKGNQAVAMRQVETAQAKAKVVINVDMLPSPMETRLVSDPELGLGFRSGCLTVCLASLLRGHDCSWANSE